MESWIWWGTSMVRGLISERSYPWAVETAELNARSGLYFRVKARRKIRMLFEVEV